MKGLAMLAAGTMIAASSGWAASSDDSFASGLAQGMSSIQAAWNQRAGGISRVNIQPHADPGGTPPVITQPGRGGAGGHAVMEDQSGRRIFAPPLTVRQPSQIKLRLSEEELEKLASVARSAGPSRGNSLLSRRGGFYCVPANDRPLRNDSMSAEHCIRARRGMRGISSIELAVRYQENATRNIIADTTFQIGADGRVSPAEMHVFYADQNWNDSSQRGKNMRLEEIKFWYNYRK